MNTMEEKIKKSAKAVDIATKIFYIAMTVCACMIAVGIIWSLVYPAAATYQLNDRVSLASPLFNMSFRSRAHMYSWCIDALLHPEVVEHGVNGTLAVVAVIFLCLSYIFQYGSELQRLNDETL